MAGYHLKEIPKGIYQEKSKIIEELYELKDAIEQGAYIMELCEISDIFLALKQYIYGDKLRTLNYQFTYIFNGTYEHIDTKLDIYDLIISIIDILNNIDDKIKILNIIEEFIYYLSINRYVGIEVSDFVKMSKLTYKAFHDGIRK